MNDSPKFYQVSDKVPSYIITSVTNSCDREDCCISARMGESTTAGTSEHYDFYGVLRVSNPNRFTANLCCKSCWKSWTVDNEGKIL
jgi:hypothetical protein